MGAYTISNVGRSDDSYSNGSNIRSMVSMYVYMYIA